MRGRRGSWGMGAVPLPEREGETIGEEDANRWVPPVIGGREGEGYPFRILAGWKKWFFNILLGLYFKSYANIFARELFYKKG
jgi:hypothetical protein